MAEALILVAGPSIAPITTPAAICSGTSLLGLAAPAVTPSVPAPSAQGWYLAGIPISATTTLTVSDNGKNLYYQATNACGTVTSNSVTITVNTMPSIMPIAVSGTVCVGSNLNLTTPPIDDHGLVTTSQGWYLNGDLITNRTPMRASDNGSFLTYRATNACGTATSNSVAITVNDVPLVAGITTPAAICSDNSLSLTAPMITNNGATPSSQGWYLAGAAISNTSSKINFRNGRVVEKGSSRVWV